MATVRLADVIVPETFTKYQVQNSVEKTDFWKSGALLNNAAIQEQLTAGANSFTIPYWLDLANTEADIANDDPDQFSTPGKIGSGKQIVRKAYLHSSWSTMNLASELSGDDAANRIQDRVASYWGKQWQRRAIATLNGVLANNIADNNGDMVLDITKLTGEKAKFSATAVIDCAQTMGDAADGLVGICMHSDTYSVALKADLIEFVKDSAGRPIRTYRGLFIVVDDSMPRDDGEYVTTLVGFGALGFGISEPRIAPGTEIENIPGAGNGGGQIILHSRFNVGIQPLGFSWLETNVEGESPTLAEVALPVNWKRVAERKAVPLAFLVHRL